MPYQEKEIKKEYLTVTDLAAELEVSESLIRYYMKEGVFTPDKVNRVHLYKATNLDRIRKVVELGKKKLYTVKGLKYIYNNQALPKINEMI